MASPTNSPPAVSVPFDVGIHTPANLNRGARTALLQNSPAVVNGPVGVSPVFGRAAQTSSSPTTALSTAAVTEGAQLAAPPPPPILLGSQNDNQSPSSTFCTKFEEAAQQFTTELELEFAQAFADSFLDSWKQVLAGAKTAPTPTYSSVAAYLRIVISRAKVIFIFIFTYSQKVC
ncbi:hypothetical protein B0J13DRAFT_527187 [Dactylonectria estremocensis]|uniref:Uncharacterized protein n=1 Tax=Dactylonectria estremocensis TaxID=1079267 RepID=A0A9P9J410_9HYPO|nr:hypothetical protein B0J13DRAFT_527187 [Dactylonectria estremocensis]